jgi:hypothetical protein
MKEFKRMEIKINALQPLHKIEDALANLGYNPDAKHNRVMVNVMQYSTKAYYVVTFEHGSYMISNHTTTFEPYTLQELIHYPYIGKKVSALSYSLVLFMGFCDGIFLKGDDDELGRRGYFDETEFNHTDIK